MTSIDTKAALEMADYLQFGHEARAAAMLRSLVAEGAWESEVCLTILSEDPAEFDAAVDRARKSAA